jgi:hypothetical protein
VEADLSSLFTPFRAIVCAKDAAANATGGQPRPLADDAPALSHACDGGLLAAPIVLRSTGAASDLDLAAEESSPAAAAALWEECAKRCEADGRCHGFSTARRKAEAGGSGWGPGGAVGAHMTLQCSLHAAAVATDRRSDGGGDRAAAARDAIVSAHLGCFARSNHEQFTRYEWRLAARSLDSSQTLLNGLPIRLAEGKGGAKPALTPPVLVGGRSHIRLTPRSVGFFLFPEASWPECM